MSTKRNRWLEVMRPHHELIVDTATSPTPIWLFMPTESKAFCSLHYREKPPAQLNRVNIRSIPKHWLFTGLEIWSLQSVSRMHLNAPSTICSHPHNPPLCLRLKEMLAARVLISYQNCHYPKSGPPTTFQTLYLPASMSRSKERKKSIGFLRLKTLKGHKIPE